MIFEAVRYIRANQILWIIIAIGWIVNLTLVLPMNARMGHDTYWHLSLIAVAFKTFPPQNPIFAGEMLHGYNYLLDLFMYWISLLGIPPLHIYLIILPIIYLFFTTIFSTVFALRYKKSLSFVASFLFFSMLATPFSYVLSFYRRGTFWEGFTFPTVMQSSTALGNLSYAMTIPILLYVLILLIKGKLGFRQVLALGLLVFVSFGIKFYGGVVITVLICLYFLIQFIKDRKFRKVIRNFFIIVFFVFLALVVFYQFPASANKGSIFAFYPLSTVHPFIENPDSFYIRSLVLARYTLMESDKFSPRLVAIELFTITIYLIYNAGTRTVAVFSILYKGVKRQWSHLEMSILGTIIFTLLMSLLFIQKGTDWWNTVQFLGYGLFLLNIFAALSIYELLKKYSLFRFGVVICIVFLTIPLNIELGMRAVRDLDQSDGLSVNEKDALSFLKTQKYGIIFTVPVIYNSSYVSALTEKPVYYGDESVLSNVGVAFEKRKKELIQIEKFDFENKELRYIYMEKKDGGMTYQRIRSRIDLSGNFENIFENSEVVIYRILEK